MVMSYELFMVVFRIPLGMHRSVEKVLSLSNQHPVRDGNLYIGRIPSGMRNFGVLFFFYRARMPTAFNLLMYMFND